jgi:hypothetical protein
LFPAFRFWNRSEGPGIPMRMPSRPAPPRRAPPVGGWDDTIKPVGTRVRLTTGRCEGAQGVVERHQRVVRPAWDELHHWVRLDAGSLKLYAARFLEVIDEA